MIPRRILPYLVVVLALVTAWASYNVSSQVSVGGPAAPTPPVLTYQGSGSYFYAATLAPNDLYNSTTISGSNLTLFAPITRWINLTFVDGVTLSTPAETHLVDHFSVTLSTAAWSKTIDQVLHQNASVNSTGISLVDRYAVNVSVVENLTRTIDSQLGYSPSQFTVAFTPVITGDISLGNQTTPVSMDPFLNLTFEAAIITPRGLTTSLDGAIPSGNGPSDPGRGMAVAYAYLLLAGSLAGLTVFAGLFVAARRGSRTAALPELQTLIEPYEEVIVHTTTTPEAATVFPLAQWDDIVKVADTLGRPILRPIGGTGQDYGATFYVVDGSVAYRYDYPSIRSPEGNDSAASLDGGDPHSDRGNGALEPARSDGAAEERVVTIAPAARSVDAPESASAQLRADLDRLQGTRLSPEQRALVLELIRSTARRIRSSPPDDTRRILAEFHRTFEGYLRDSLPEA